MADEKKDFKEVKVKVAGGNKEFTDTISRSMLYSGVNIFGTLTKLYMSSKEEFTSVALNQNVKVSQSSQAEGSLGGASGSSIMQLDTNVLQIFKKLQKRDTVTKVKAFNELNAYVDKIEQDSDELPNLLTFFLYHMCRILINEPDKHVREATHETFAAFIRKAKRRLGPHLCKIFPLWYCSFFDPSPEVAKIARANFDIAFPPEKQPEVFKIVFKNFLHFANEQLQSSEEVNEGTSKESKALMDDSFDRITSTVLQALANSFTFTENWPQVDREKYLVKMLSNLDLVIDSEPAGKQPKPRYIWNFLQPNFRGRVRSACLQFLASFINKMPSEVVKAHTPQISPLVFAIVGDSNSILQTTFWREALFTLGKNQPECWTYVNLKKDFLPKLNKCLKEAAFGAPVALYQNFVKFVSVCPLYQLKEFKDDKLNKASFKERCNLIRECMVNLYHGLQNDEAVTFHRELINSYAETLTFILLKRIGPLEVKADLDFALVQMEKVIQVPLEDFIANYQKFKSKVQNQRNPRSKIASRMATVLLELSQRDLNEGIFTTVCDIFARAIIPEKRNSMRIIAAVIKVAKTISPQYQQIVYSQILVKTLTTQISEINRCIPDLSKANIILCNDLIICYNRYLYTVCKLKVTSQEFGPLPLLECGIHLDSVLKKQQMAKNVLTKEVTGLFQNIKMLLTDTSILHLTAKFDEKEQFQQVLIAAGLLEPETNISEVDPLLGLIFLPHHDKVDYANFFECLRSTPDLHELMVGSLSIKMMEPTAIHIYRPILQNTIQNFQDNKPSILMQEDVEMIRQLISENLQDSQLPPVAITAYYQSVSCLCSNGDEANNELRQILLAKLVSMRVTKANEEQYNELWSIFRQALQKNQHYITYCVSELGKSVQDLILNSNQSLQAVESFTHLTRLVRQFADCVPDKVGSLSKILLVQQNFANLDSNCMPLKMFKDLFLQGGVGFDIQSLLQQKQGEQYTFVWLAAMLLNFKHLVSLSQFMDLKKQLMIFVETEVITSLVALAATDAQLIVQIFKELASKMEKFTHTLQYLAVKMVDPGEQFPSDVKPVLKIDNFKQIYHEIVLPAANSLLESNFSDLKASKDVLVIILQAFGYYIIDEPTVVSLYKRVKQNITTDLDLLSQTKVQLDIYMALEKWLSHAESVETETQISLLNKLLVQNSIEMKQIAVDLCSSLLDRKPISQIKAGVLKDELHSVILDLLEVSDSESTPCTSTIQLCRVIRKTLDWTDASNSIVSLFIQNTMDRALDFDIAMANLKNLKSINSIKSFEIEMLQEMAETLLMCPNTFSEETLKASLENHLYYLVGCGVEALQKSAFVLLKYIYENFQTPMEFEANMEDDLKMLMQNQEETKETKMDVQHSSAFKNISSNLIKVIENPPKITQQDGDEQEDYSGQSQLEQLVFGQREEGCMNGKVFGYLLTWNAMLYKIEHGRIKSQLGSESGNAKATQYMQVLSALTEYLETDTTTYEMMLVSIVPYLPMMKGKGSPPEFIKELTTFQPEYCQVQDQKSGRIMALMTLTNFMKSFPSLGRKFYQDCDRSILEITLPYIKQVVSPAILDNEIKKIELSQLELGADSPLNFVLFKSTKEVVASYTKTAEITAQLKLKIPSDYPLKSVVVDIGEQLKLKQSQIRRWTLSIRNLLQSRNGDIISAILLWKSNIDKEMDGIEECFICYSVCHQSDRSLPSMQCKNCKNKFHVACIRKWFNTSNKSNCPLCQTFFFQ